MTAAPILAPAPGLAEAVDHSVAECRTLLGHWWDKLVAEWSDLAPELGEILRAAEPSGGKFVRARLVAAAYHGSGGTDGDTAARLAAAVQLLHAALCLHDDIIDGDERRHGRRNVIGVVTDLDRAAGRPPEAARRQGRSAGLLVGDLLLTNALRVAGELDGELAGRGAAPAGRLAREFHDAVSASIQGELLDVRAEWAVPDRVDARQVAGLKTATYSVVLPLRAGAIAAGCHDADQLGALRRIGETIGVAYQLADDELGLLGDESVTGKPVLADLRAGKRTELLAQAYRLAEPADRQTLDRLLTAPAPDPAQQRQVVDIVLRTGAVDRTRTLARHLAGQTRAALDRLPPALADYLGQLVTTLTDRDR